MHHLEYMINRVDVHPVPPAEAGRAHYPVAIRRAGAADVPLLHDLAELDSAKPLAGPVLVAVIEGRIWAAIGVDSGRVIADPFLPTGPAVELLRLRVAQLGAADGRRPQRGLWPVLVGAGGVRARLRS